MAFIIGKIDSGKRLKNAFIERGVSDINSLKDISDFRLSYFKQLEKIQSNSRLEIESEIEQNSVTCEELKQDFEDRVQLETSILKNTIESIDKKAQISKEKSTSSDFFKKYYNLFYYFFLNRRKKWLERNFEKIINQRTNYEKKLWDSKKKEYEIILKNKESIYTERWKSKSHYIRNKHKAIEDFKYLRLGALGETKVVREIEKLNDSNYLINDFSISFDKPLYHPQTKQIINKVQIDHLLVNKAGIFLLETKNWSKKSIDSLNLRSPVEQIKRANYAVYSIVNEANLLNYHHWGEKTIDIRNIIVLINNKPRETFKYVKLKKLSELNNYITSFDNVLTSNEVHKIVYFLKEKNYC